MESDDWHYGSQPRLRAPIASEHIPHNHFQRLEVDFVKFYFFSKVFQLNLIRRHILIPELYCDIPRYELINIHFVWAEPC